MLKLTSEQQKKVEENMGLVGKVIQDKVNGANRLGIYSYDDLFQIGCIGLCKAAATNNGIAKFSTYAYRLIWNEICDALIYASRRNSTELLSEDGEVNAVAPYKHENELKNTTDLKDAIAFACKAATPSMQRAVDIFLKSIAGYSCKEIAIEYAITPNCVSAYISRVKKYLRSFPDIKSIYEGV